MRAAHSVYTLARRRGQKLSVIGVPKTTDNDILWCWQSVGLLSAANKAGRTFSSERGDPVEPPAIVLQLFGSDSDSSLTCGAGLSGPSLRCALIPEVPFSMKALAAYIKGRLKERYARARKGSDRTGWSSWRRRRSQPTVRTT